MTAAQRTVADPLSLMELLPVTASSVTFPTQAPLFPIPECSLFPGQVLPLHVFEPRYRQMACDALAGDRVIAVAALSPGYEPDYFTPHAPIYPVVGVGRIESCVRYPDGRLDMLLRGTWRARVVTESHVRPYRVADLVRIESCRDLPLRRAGAVSTGLLEALQRALLADGRFSPCVRAALDEVHSLSEATDVIAAAMPKSAETAQLLLGEAHVVRRAHLLTEVLNALVAAAPQEFAAGDAPAWLLN